MRTERFSLQKHKHQYQMYVELTYLKLAYTTFKETGRYRHLKTRGPWALIVTWVANPEMIQQVIWNMYST